MQSLFIFLYLNQDRRYLFEYRAFVSSNEIIVKERIYNEALNIIYNEITNDLKFENDNVKVLGNISKNKMSEIDWHVKWFSGNESLFFSTGEIKILKLISTEIIQQNLKSIMAPACESSLGFLENLISRCWQDFEPVRNDFRNDRINQF